MSSNGDNTWLNAASFVCAKVENLPPNVFLYATYMIAMHGYTHAEHVILWKVHVLEFRQKFSKGNAQGSLLRQHITIHTN